MVRATNRIAVATALAALLAGCASGAMRAGQKAERLEDFDRAVVEYSREVRENPDNLTGRLSLDRAKLRASQEHYGRGRRLSNAGRLEESLVELQMASELNPGSGDVDRELTSVRNQLRNKVAVAREGKTQLETLIERTRDLQAEGNDLPADAKLPASVTFRDASSRDVFTALARFASVNVIFDPTFRD